MSYMLVCPHCHQEGLDARRAETHCIHCGEAFRLLPRCPSCEAELERVQGCGAVDLFCNQCNSLVSKRSANYEITAQRDRGG